ncbi:MAG: hypothetical protein WCW66_02890 [Patescibacteria group bacterium]|jgi:hypothetical protein
MTNDNKMGVPGSPYGDMETPLTFRERFEKFLSGTPDYLKDDIFMRYYNATILLIEKQENGTISDIESNHLRDYMVSHNLLTAEEARPTPDERQGLYDQRRKLNNRQRGK